MKYKWILILIIAIFIGYFLIQNIQNKDITPEVPIVEEKIPVVKNELAPQAGLPAVVEAKRQAIYKAALTRDYDTLASEAEQAPNFNYSFGGEYEGGFAGYMKLAAGDEGKSAFEIIPMLLELPYALNHNSIRGDIYTWPSVFTIEPSKWTSEDIAIMKTFLTDEQIQSYRDFGGYIYYRMGITSDGKWVFYLAGD